MGGALRDIYEEWRHQLKGCLAHAEAVIDFGDDEVRPCTPPPSLSSHACAVEKLLTPQGGDVHPRAAPVTYAAHPLSHTHTKNKSHAHYTHRNICSAQRGRQCTNAHTRVFFFLLSQ